LNLFTDVKRCEERERRCKSIVKSTYLHILLQNTFFSAILIISCSCSNIERHVYSFSFHSQIIVPNLLKIIKRPTFRFRSATRCVTILMRSWFHTALFHRGIRKIDFTAQKVDGPIPLVFCEARAAYRVHALCARPTYLLGAKITVNNGHCTFCRVGRIDECARRPPRSDSSFVSRLFSVAFLKLKLKWEFHKY